MARRTSPKTTTRRKKKNQNKSFPFTIHKLTQNPFSILFFFLRLPFRIALRIFIAFGTPFYYFFAGFIILTLLLGSIFFNNIQRFISLLLHVFKRKKGNSKLKNLSQAQPAKNLGAVQATNIFIRVIPKSAYVFIFIVFFMTALGTIFYQLILKDLPRPETLLTRQPIVTTKIFDRNGVLLYSIYKDQNRTIVPLSAIPDHLKKATISIEDKDFYQHKGLSIRGVARAIKANIEKQSIQGGSTITQQLIKNTLLSPERTFTRKIKEAVLALWTETKISKDDILAMYFNEVSYGGSLHGAEAASRAYFGKSVTELNLAESSFLAGLPQAPSSYSPFGPKPEAGIARQHLVLQRMVEDGYITTEEAAKAQAEPLNFKPDRNDIKAPHFVMYVREILAQKFGEDVVSQGGLQVWTSLDYEVQKTAENAIQKELLRLQRMNVKNGAAMVTNPQTGEILAMVGSQNYFDVKNDGQVNVAIRPRQPGSSIKPLTYATAMERGLITPVTTIEDAPITYRTIGSPPYSPKNYDGRFHGKVTVRTALANSYNIPAVKTLASVGVQSVVEKGRQLGITTWDDNSASRFGLALTLGGGEVTMADMARVFGTFATNGKNVPLDPLLKVEDFKGNIKYQNPCLEQAEKPELCARRQALDPRIAFQITNILSDNVARAPAFGLRSVLHIPDHQVAVKTGTTNSLRDNWTDGYISNRVVVTWVGNNDNTPMSAVASGITGASPIWNTIMNSLLSKDSPHVFPIPDDFVKVKVCVSTGKPPCGSCDKTRDEWFLPGSEPKSGCSGESVKMPEVIATPLATRDRILNGANTETLR